MNVEMLTLYEGNTSSFKKDKFQAKEFVGIVDIFWEDL